MSLMSLLGCPYSLLVSCVYRKRCSRCKKAKPMNMKDNFVNDPALEAMNSQQTHDWQEVIDPNSRQM
jgi:hypothetical protein